VTVILGGSARQNTSSYSRDAKQNLQTFQIVMSNQRSNGRKRPPHVPPFFVPIYKIYQS
jgi:hypothetical protein